MPHLSFQGIKYIARMMPCAVCNYLAKTYDVVASNERGRYVGDQLVGHFHNNHAEVEKQVCVGVVGN